MSRTVVFVSAKGRFPLLLAKNLSRLGIHLIAIDSENSTYLNVNLSLHDSTDIVRDLEDACSLAEVTNVLNFSTSTSEVAGRISDKLGLKKSEFKFTPEDAKIFKIRTAGTTQYFFS